MVCLIEKKWNIYSETLKACCALVPFVKILMFSAETFPAMKNKQTKETFPAQTYVKKACSDWSVDLSTEEQIEPHEAANMFVTRKPLVLV